MAAFVISGAAVATTVGPPACTDTHTLTGSAFEIDTNANLVVDTSNCIDWLTGGSGTDLRSGVLSKADKTTGTGDDAFGQGTSENDANPTIVSGSIPPNKSDLKKFGLYSEVGESSTDNPTGKFLELFWARVQNPSGTTNMDFELNQKFCDPTATPTNCASNGKNVSVPETPVRTTGDKLITYDLSKGGTVPTISIRTWNGSAWGAATVISGGNSPAALGSVNTSAITAAESDDVGPLDAFTFGEASVTFGALFGTSTCGSFGSAYLKSRSSDSFTSELKDFIAPEHVSISNCTDISTSATASVTLGSSISDTATLTGATNPTGAVTFNVYTDSTCTTLATNPSGADIAGSALVSDGNGGFTSTATYTPGAVGDYYWIASFAGDGSNSSATGDCADANEHSVVTKANSSIATDEVLVPNDSASITPSSATGSVHFYLFKPGQTCSVANEANAVYDLNVSLTSGSASTANSDNTDTLAGSHAAAIGTWKWLAAYGGDSSLNGNTSLCDETFTITEP